MEASSVFVAIPRFRGDRLFETAARQRERLPQDDVGAGLSIFDYFLFTIRTIQMARHEPLFDFRERGSLAIATVHRVRAARVEVAAGRRAQRRGHLAREHDFLAPLVR